MTKGKKKNTVTHRKKLTANDNKLKLLDTLDKVMNSFDLEQNNGIVPEQRPTRRTTKRQKSVAKRPKSTNKERKKSVKKVPKPSANPLPVVSVLKDKEMPATVNDKKKMNGRGQIYKMVDNLSEEASSNSSDDFDKKLGQ